jgi:hypothetical protein
MGPCPLAAVVRLLAYSSRAGSQCDHSRRPLTSVLDVRAVVQCSAAGGQRAPALPQMCAGLRCRLWRVPAQMWPVSVSARATSCSQPRRRARAVRTRRKGSPHGRWKSACVSVRARVWAACGHACAGIMRRAGELSCLNRRGLCCEVGIVERVAPVGLKRNRQHLGRAGQPAVPPDLARVGVVVPALER